MSDPHIRLACAREIENLVSKTVEIAASEESDLEHRAEVTLEEAISSGGLMGSFPELAGRWESDAERRVLVGAVVLGLSLGRAETAAGWRESPKIDRSGSSLRRWWEDKRPRWADRRAVEALVDLQRGALEEDSLLSAYLVVLSYWHSFDL